MCARSYEGLVVSRESHGDQAHGDCAGFGWWEGLALVCRGIFRGGMGFRYLFSPLWVGLAEFEGIEN
jgi:hypothetical protein